MKIFDTEIRDGLSDKIKSGSSLALLCPVEAYMPVPSQEGAEQLRIVSGEAGGSEQIDLYYLNSILVSTGWNKNDDVFDVAETWVARHSPEDKQFNYMHDEADIIGHITANIVIGGDGNEVPDNTVVENLPERFDIVTSSVLYNSWASPELKERMETIIAEIEDGKWFVSMECLFSAFDYAVVTPDGAQHVVARDDASAFLTKHLRSYGGTGEYEGHKVGRLLRNVSFSGKGLVNNPANPRSVILTESNPFIKTEAKSINQLDITKEKYIMSNDERLLQQVEELKAQLKSTKEELQAKANEATSEELETFKTTVAEKDETITELQEAVKALEGKISENEELVAKQAEELSEANQQILSYEKEAITLARRNSLTEAGVDSDEATSILEAFTEANDEMFDELVKQLAKFVPFKKKDDKEDDEDKDDEGKPWEKKKKKDAKSEESEESEASEEEDEAEASAEEEILENVEEEAGAALVDAGETDGIKSVRAIASEWLSSNVLRTTANIDS
jgi:hypothetical protein